MASAMIEQRQQVVNLLRSMANAVEAGQWGDHAICFQRAHLFPERRMGGMVVDQHMVGQSLALTTLSTLYAYELQDALDRIDNLVQGRAVPPQSMRMPVR